jgi:branched-chain amino acid transport system permease protein
MSSALIVYFEFVGIYLLLVWAIYLPFRGGQLYNGPFYCMAIGAYAASYAAKDLHWPTGLALLLALALGAIAGFLPSLAFSRTSGIVTATASMALIYIIQAIIRNTEFIGAARGYWSIPRMDYLPIVTWGCVLLVGFLIYRIESSRIGRALEAMRTDPALAGALGMNSPWISVFVMTIASVIGSLAGVLYAFTIRALTAESFGFALLLNTMAMLFIGGRYTMWGGIISVPILWGLPMWAPTMVAPYVNMIIGVLLVITLMVRPEGLIGREMVQRLRIQVGSRLRQVKKNQHRQVNDIR